ncbi:chromosome segregation protein SMC [Pseudogracilibacillus sp. SE30717A]|uniref:chromosome segregation protein SMC n=1 Tax=Pseudogracilibacillus sp. SE30717A TaxID=3098293 RepID=UPI00300DD9E8
MFLKRLETVGFKSFAERIQVEFVSGVTAVVGPNGSGKSNIIDAVRWVLGEQSARSLRGKKMEDIIFQGSDTRNALNFAEVSLVLNNDGEKLPIDFHEVNITRRVYRSGESEFFINKQSCRLKDIVDLFMDTGLGRESFSIIGQGKIDEILSSKAEERRAIFEEAAGVLKYKQRKNQAKFKLTETEDNLDRVEDIIHEIEQQIEPLKKQASVAKEYKAKKADLKKNEIALLVTEIEQLHSKWKLLLEEIEKEKLLEVEKKTAIQKREAELTEERQKIQQLDNEITSLQNELVVVTEQLEQFEGKRNVLKERFKHLSENKQKLIQEKTLKMERINEIEQHIQQEKTVLAEVNNTIMKATDEIQQIESNLYEGLDEIKEEIEDLKSDYIEHLNKQAVLQSDLNTIKRQLETAENKTKDESVDYERLQKQEQTLITSLHQSETNITSLIDKITVTEKEIEHVKHQVLTSRTTFEEMQKRLYEGNEQIAKIISRKEMLEEMKDSFQGFFYGVKEILKASKEDVLTEIHGAVVDLIDVPTDYMTAIDTILGAQAQYIVVPNDEVARNVIHWLKKENKGRATFLPLESIEARQIPASICTQLDKQQGFIGIASNLVKVEPEFQKVVEHLMGNVILATDLQCANQLARLTNRKFRVVTLEGDVVYPGGSMSGGAKRKANQSLFTREKEITLLTEKLEQFTKRKESFMKEIDVQREMIADDEANITTLEAKLKKLKEDLEGEQARHNDIAIKCQSITDELASYRISKEQEKEYTSNLHVNLKEIQQKLETVNNQIKATEQRIEKRTAEEKNIEDNKRNLETRLHELQVKLAELEERKKSVEDRIHNFSNQLSEHRDELEQIDAQLNELDELEQSENKENDLMQRILLQREKREETTQMIDNKRVERDQKVQLSEDEEREIRQIYKLHEDFVRKVQDKEVQANRLDVSLENHLSLLQTEYTMTYEKAAQQYEKVQDVQVASQQVKAIKQEIKQLGTVNLGSIEEYERLSERYVFLSEQKQDLVEAKETLYSVIQEMDKEMTSRFTGMFTEIQTAFTDVFKQLFGGGHAELTLTDPDNILETGIEIVARPPGKKLRTLGLLSGGERALTAIALLFAILRARPVPFCILDEVDAALDEANVARFGSYLKTFSKDTQFIVITHRQGTMEEADALYGVTMQESGVSRLVSVKLEDTSDLVKAT